MNKYLILLAGVFFIYLMFSCTPPPSHEEEYIDAQGRYIETLEEGIAIRDARIKQLEEANAFTDSCFHALFKAAKGHIEREHPSQ